MSFENDFWFFGYVLNIYLNLILKTYRLYNVFGSSASYGTHAQFLTQTSALNNAKRIDLLQGAGTRFATWLYAMYQLLSQKQVLYATVHSPAIQTLSHNARDELAMQNIENSPFFRVIYCLMRAMFPALCVLRYCVANIPVMDKMYYLVKMLDDALLSSQTILNDEGFFGSMSSALCDRVNKEISTVFGNSEEEWWGVKSQGNIIN